MSGQSRAVPSADADPSAKADLGRRSRANLRAFDESLPMGLLRAREATMRVFRPMLATHDLTEQQWRVLRALHAADDPLDASTLAERTFLLSSSLSRILVNLDERGFLVRQPDPADQRRSLIELSDVGRKLVAEVAPESEAGYRSIEAQFGEQRLAALMDELLELANLDLGGDQ